MNHKNKRFSEKIRQLRQDKHETELEVADAIGVTEKEVHYWEMQRSNPHRNLLPKIAQHFDIELETLLEFTNLTLQNKYRVLGKAKSAALPHEEQDGVDSP